MSGLDSKELQVVAALAAVSVVATWVAALVALVAVLGVAVLFVIADNPPNTGAQDIDSSLGDIFFDVLCNSYSLNC